MSFILKTNRLTIRAIELDDLEALKVIWGDNEVMRCCGGPIEGLNRLTRSIQYYQTLDAMTGISAYAICLNETNEMIGICGFNPTESKGTLELIYHFKQSSWGHGYASEATDSLIDYLKSNFDRETLHTLKASVGPDNPRSVRVLEKCGFKFEKEVWFEDTNRYEPVYQLAL